MKRQLRCQNQTKYSFLWIEPDGPPANSVGSAGLRFSFMQRAGQIAKSLGKQAGN